LARVENAVHEMLDIIPIPPPEAIRDLNAARDRVEAEIMRLMAVPNEYLKEREGRIERAVTASKPSEWADVYAEGPELLGFPPDPPKPDILAITRDIARGE